MCIVYVPTYCTDQTTHCLVCGPLVFADGMRMMSVWDMVQAKSLEALLSYCNELQDKN